MDILECGHCGGDAIASENGMFYEDEGEACMSCSFPGHVTVYDLGNEDEASAYWSPTDDPTARCNQADCEDCRELDAAP